MIRLFLQMTDRTGLRKCPRTGFWKQFLVSKTLNDFPSEPQMTFRGRSRKRNILQPKISRNSRIAFRPRLRRPPVRSSTGPSGRNTFVCDRTVAPDRSPNVREVSTLSPPPTIVSHSRANNAPRNCPSSFPDAFAWCDSEDSILGPMRTHPHRYYTPPLLHHLKHNKLNNKARRLSLIWHARITIQMKILISKP